MSNAAKGFDNVYDSNVVSTQGSLWEQIQQSYPSAKIEFDDVFTSPEGKARDRGWHYHDQANSAVLRPSPQFSIISARGKSLALVTDNAQETKTVARKSPGTRQLPYHTKKIILGVEWAWHSWWLYGMFRVMFSLDTQVGLDKRDWYKIGYVRSINGSSSDNKWQYCATGADTPTWTDITGATFTSAWNEPYKPTFGTAFFVFDVENRRYEKLWTNGEAIDLTGLAMANTGDDLAEYPDCYNTYMQCENRSTGSTLMSGLYLDRVLVATIS